METNINNSNFIIAEVKPEITEVTCSGHSYVDIDRKNADNALTMKEEEENVESSVLMAEFNSNAISTTGNIFGIASNIKIKLDVNDERSYKGPGDRSDTSGSEGSHCSDLYTKTCTTKNVVLKHTTSNDNERYKCKICHGHFKTRNTLLKHVNLHSEEINQKGARGARSRRRRYINTNEETHECHTCKKSFTFKGNLSRHVKMHAGKRNYDCKICAKRFTRNEHLSTHVKTHTGERNHECKICGKFFTRKEGLSEHLKVHTGERNYDCEICAKCFTTKFNMLEHMKIHTGERKYKCAVCPKSFTRKPNLLQHAKMHAGDSNYKCEFCARCFTANRGLSRHMNTHVKKNYKCQICDEYFEKKAVLLEHKKTHAEGSREEDSLRKVSYDALCIRRFKEETAIKVEKKVDSDTIEWSTAINGSCVDAAAMEETPKRAEIFNLWQSLNNEVIVKEEAKIMGTA